MIERDGEFELISNGALLMDTRDGRSERQLTTAAIAAHGGPVRRLLLGGLGVGFSLAAALDHGVPEVVVVECEPAVVAWNAHTAARTGGRLDHPAVRCHVADVVAWLRGPGPAFDVICLDVDNGPDRVVGGDNGWLYTDAGLACLRARLTTRGVLAVWSSAAAPAFASRLARHVGVVEVVRVPVARGEPDHVYVATTADRRRSASERRRAPAASPEPR